MASADAVRDAFALVMCSLTGDDEGAGVIKDNAADLGEVAGVMADTVSELFRGHARALADGDPVKLLDRGAGRAGRGPDRAPRGRAAGTLPPGGLPQQPGRAAARSPAGRRSGAASWAKPAPLGDARQLRPHCGGHPTGCDSALAAGCRLPPWPRSVFRSFSVE